MKKLFVITILTLIVGAPQSWGYTNPIEDGGSEIVTNLWDLRPESLYVGSNTAGNAMTVVTGGIVENVGGYIGYQSGSTSNRVEVTGTNAVWSNSASLNVGSAGTDNELFIMNGGRVQNTYGAIGANSNASHNTVTVSGSGSVWSNSISLRVGSSGSDNELSITDGGVVQNNDWGVIGSEVGSDNNGVTVSGTGSVWSTSGIVLVGSSGSGNAMTITNGGNVQSTGGYIGLDVSAPNNTVTVSSAGSIWSNSGSFYLGREASGNAISITDSGCMKTVGGYIGYQSGSSNNTATVTGADSKWENSLTLILGLFGSSNALSITEGGTVENIDGCVGHQAGGGNNTVMVSGGGSVWNNFGSLYVGGNSSGAGGLNNSVTVSNGAVVSAASLTIYPSNSFNLASGGWLKTATVHGDLNVYGIFAPGNSTTNSVVNGALSFGSGGAVEMEIGGYGQGTDYDHLTVTGLTTFDGSLNVVLIDGFEPDYGSSFDLFDGDGGVGGGFATMNLPSLSFGLEWNPDDLYAEGNLSVDYSTADTDGDGMADGWELQHFGGDASRNGNPDLDPHNNFAEYIAGTDPTNSSSFFHITNTTLSASGFVIEWSPSVSNREYVVLWTNALANGLTSLVTGIDFPQNSYTDTTYNVKKVGFYRVNVQLKE